MKLLAKDPPFLFIILIGSLSWMTTHIVSRTLEKPIIEYVKSSPGVATDLISCDDKATPSSTKITRFEITNISQKSLFSQLEFLVVAENGKIHGLRMRALAPAVSGDTPEKCYPTHAEFLDITLHPSATFQLDVMANLDTALSLRLKKSSTPINLISQNLETLMVKYETWILLGFLLVVTGAVIWFLKQILQVNKTVSAQTEDKDGDK